MACHRCEGYALVLASASEAKATRPCHRRGKSGNRTLEKSRRQRSTRENAKRMKISRTIWVLNGLEEELWERGRSKLTRPYSELERVGGRRVKGRSGGLGNGSGFVLECCVG
ncbi:hypothetical protein L3X38_008249 [Prunus dulcis]|uniref:Uncharacterized protein n=1 Tax=Prunus dulcis TaxID=3755 RepID=A0AAD5F6U2_PRUDU|nr:hypothetical protein L3X38_008249 [Prunus dulcis]